MSLAMSNPLLQPWSTPYGLPPFEQVRAEHFEPAFDEALKQHRAEIDAGSKCSARTCSKGGRP